MKSPNKILIIRQLDKKLSFLQEALLKSITQKGWIHLFRHALGMSLRQFGQRLQITPQGMKDIERREEEGTITLNALKEVADALDMHFVYAFIPKKYSLEQMVERKAREYAQKIVSRTSTTMKLEGQENSEERIKQSIEELTAQIKHEMPRNLWD